VGPKACRPETGGGRVTPVLVSLGPDVGGRSLVWGTLHHKGNMVSEGSLGERLGWREGGTGGGLYGGRGCFGSGIFRLPQA